MTSLAARAYASPEVRLHPRLPVRVADGRGAAGDHELPRHEVVVRDRVGGQVAEVAEAEGAHRIRFGQVVDLLTHVPEVAVASQRSVVLRDGRVGRDVAVEKVEGVCAEEIGDDGREHRQVRQHRLAEIDVGAGCPGVRRVRRDEKEESDDDHRPQQAASAHRRLGTSMRRTRPSMPLPWREVRSAAATSRAVSSTSSCTRS